MTGDDDRDRDDEALTIGTGPWSDAEFQALARRVRRTAEEELAEIEYETERADLKREDLTARSMRAMMEGERWQVMAGPRVIDGAVVHAGLDFTCLEDRAGNLHDLTHRAIEVIRLVGQDPTGGRAPITLRPATFRARLLGLEQHRAVELAAAAASWVLQGTIDSVNSDHLVLIDANGNTSVIPIAAIGALSRSPIEHRRQVRGAAPGHRP
jgi:hypothetical protein